MSVSILIPQVPDRALSPNWHGHWSDRAKAVAELRYTARLATYGSLREEERARCASWRSVVMDVEIAWCCGRKRVDPTNMPGLLKAMVDGVADVLFEGNDRRVVFGDLTQSRGAGEMIVRLREAS